VSQDNDIPPGPELMSGSEVERQTGIRQATLRMWEKRYGFPQPLRDGYGNRVYPANQVAYLRATRDLLDQGFRPGKIFSGATNFEASRLDELRRVPDQVPAQYQPFLSLLRQYRRPELHTRFQTLLLDMGLRRFVIEFLGPLATAVGVAWNRGELPIRCERLFSEMTQSILHAKQAAARGSTEGKPTVVLATITSESHVLGIMMAEAVMASLGMDCLQLGGGVPVEEVADAARETGADIVALSFSSYFPSKIVARTLKLLRPRLPDNVVVWVGGAGVPASATFDDGVEVVSGLEQIEPALQRWRSRAQR
jgi:MerR family transcriptional regulator, light-induced transcriptional regulator